MRLDLGTFESIRLGKSRGLFCERRGQIEQPPCVTVWMRGGTMDLTVWDVDGLVAVETLTHDCEHS